MRAWRFFRRKWLGVPIVLSEQTLIAMAACLIAVVVLYRSIVKIDRIVRWLGVVVVADAAADYCRGVSALRCAIGRLIFLRARFI